MAEKIRTFQVSDEQKRPVICKECGGILVYIGLGEFRCEECGASEFDDYGRVRNYLEKHRGANVAEISDETGVSHKSIRQMLKENRFEVIDVKGGYLRCEVCGANIKSGRRCAKCEEKYHRSVEEQARKERKKEFTAYGENPHGEKGTKRFTRDE